MPKPNQFNFNSTSSLWDPEISASALLTPEVSESLRLINKTIENYVGVDHNIGNTTVELESDGNLSAMSPLLRLNLAKPHYVGTSKNINILQVQYTGSNVFSVHAPTHQMDNNNHEVMSHGPDWSIVTIRNNIFDLSSTANSSGSNFMNFWNVRSGSSGIVSESVFLLGTQGDRPVMGIGTPYPSASLHISSSITGSQTDLVRVQNDIGVPIFKIKPDRLLIRNSGSSVNEVTMSVDSNNNLMFNDSVGINHKNMFIKSGSKQVKMEVGATSGNLRFKRIGAASASINIIVGEGHIVTKVTSSAILSGKDHIISESTDATIVGGQENRIEGSGDSAIGGGAFNLIKMIPVANQNMFNYIGGGQVNHITGSNVDRSFIGGGSGNQIYGTSMSPTDAGTIGGGYSNKIKESLGGSILGGKTNLILDTGATIDAGCSWIVAGTNNTINGGSGYGSGIVGGYLNTISGSGNFHSTILGGIGNVISTANRSAIVNGSYNLAKHDEVFILGNRITSSKANTTYTENILVSGSSVLSGSIYTNGLISSSGNIDLMAGGPVHLPSHFTGQISASRIRLKSLGSSVPNNWGALWHSQSMTQLYNNYHHIRIYTSNNTGLYLHHNHQALGFGIYPTAPSIIDGESYSATFGGPVSASKNLHIGGNISKVTHITASGDILLGADRYINFTDEAAPGRQYIRGGSSYITIDSDNVFTVQADSYITFNSPNLYVNGNITASGYLSTESHITASGNISASGNITAHTGSMDYLILDYDRMPSSDPGIKGAVYRVSVGIGVHQLRISEG